MMISFTEYFIAIISSVIAITVFHERMVLLTYEVPYFFNFNIIDKFVYIAMVIFIYKVSLKYIMYFPKNQSVALYLHFLPW